MDGVIISIIYLTSAIGVVGTTGVATQIIHAPDSQNHNAETTQYVMMQSNAIA
jgi:putative effector of murein hydrolase LrgA (UPF0299 family)